MTMETKPISLQEATSEKLHLYKQCLCADSKVPFWDIVVFTAGDESQKQSYLLQIDQKKANKEIPSFVSYLVFSDPPGAKIGNGGATMHVLQQLEQTLGWKELQRAKVMMVHAGGYSQRLANVSAVGKIFMALPCGDPMLQMINAVLIMYSDLPARMNPGVFLTCSDVIFLYNGNGDWNMKEPGVTAIAHPAPLQFCTNHGVFLFKDVDSIRNRYDDDQSKPASMSDVKRFLHKSSQKTIEESGAVISNLNQQSYVFGPVSEEAYVDLAYWFDFNTAKKMLKFYSENQPIDCELDAYGDFLQALGPEATSDYCSRTGNVSVATDNLIEMREKFFELFHDTPFRAVVFNQAQFNHVGTTKEYLHHFCSNMTLIDSFQFQNETAVSYVFSTPQIEVQPDTAKPSEKRVKINRFKNCVIMKTSLEYPDSIQICAQSVVEYCHVGHGVSIGSSCIVSGLIIPPESVIPDGSFLHTIPVLIDNKTLYATFVFDISDSVKTSASKEVALELPYCQGTLENALKIFHGDNFSSIVSALWPNKTGKVCLWNCRLFPALATRKLSSQCAIDMIQCVKDASHKLPAIDPSMLLSLADMVQAKSLSALLSYCNDLQD